MNRILQEQSEKIGRSLCNVNGLVGFMKRYFKEVDVNKENYNDVFAETTNSLNILCEHIEVINEEFSIFLVSLNKNEPIKDSEQDDSTKEC